MRLGMGEGGGGEVGVGVGGQVGWEESLSY